MTTALTISDALRLMRAGELTSVELVQRAIDAADDRDAQLGVFVTRFDDAALEAAEEADRRRNLGLDAPLLGIPIGVKDILTTAEGPTTAQSLVRDRVRVSGDATAIRRLRDAGGVVVGKTTTMEFAYGTHDEDKPFPVPRNPWRSSCWAGGSSSGSGAGVAAGMMLGAVGTDTGASIRLPAALCGVTGLKPTFGVVPRDGCVPLGYSLDHVGPMARSAADCALLLEAMAGHSPDDPSSSPTGLSPLTVPADGSLRGVRIGVDGLSRFSGSLECRDLQPCFAAFVDALEDAGADVVDVELPLYREVSTTLYITVLSEALCTHLPTIREQWGDYFRSTRVGLTTGAFVSAVDYVQAQRVRRVGVEAVRGLFQDVDFVVTPTASRPAPLVSDARAFLSTLYQGEALTRHTAYWNAVGNPALTVPIGFSDGLPLGGQIIGRPFADRDVLAVGACYQRSVDWHRRIPVETEPTSGDGAMPVAPASAAPPDPTLAAGLVEMLGIVPDPAECADVYSALHFMRRNAAVLRAVAAADSVDPLLTFRL